MDFADYLENGHISQPVNPESFTGLTYWFGTAVADKNLTISEIADWNVQGTGGSQRGQRSVIWSLQRIPSNMIAVLAVTSFDDGNCGHPNPDGSHNVTTCYSKFQIPGNVETESLYTIYWLWDFSAKLGRDTKHVEVCVPASSLSRLVSNCWPV